MKQLVFLFLLLALFAGCDTYSVVPNNSVERLERLPRTTRNASRGNFQRGFPKKPDPNKCYVRQISIDKFKTTSETHLTYSKLEADEYPHTPLKIVTSPAFNSWEYTTYDGCKSPNPADCQVLCYREYPPKVDTLYVPVDSLAGNPFKRTVEIKTWYQKGGLTYWKEIDCELTTFSVLPIYFADNSTELLESDRVAIDETIIPILQKEPNLWLEFNAHTDSRGAETVNLQLSKDRAQSVVDYLVSKGIERAQLIAKGYGETRLKNHCSNDVKCTEDEHAANARVEFRVVNLDAN